MEKEVTVTVTITVKVTVTEGQLCVMHIVLVDCAPCISHNQMMTNKCAETVTLTPALVRILLQGL